MCPRRAHHEVAGASGGRGFPVTPVVRAVLDRARRLRDVDAVRALVAEAVQRRFCTPAQLALELDAGSKRGTALVRRDARYAAAAAAGIAFLPTLPRRLVTEEAAVLDELEAAYAAAARCPAPVGICIGQRSA